MPNRRRRALGVAVGILIVAASCLPAACGGGMHDVNKSPAEGEVGQPTRFGFPGVYDVTVTVRGCTFPAEVDGQTLAVVRLTIRNNGDHSVTVFGPSHWELDTRDRVPYQAVPLANAASLPAGQLSPGAEVSGDVYFRLPVSKSPLRLVFNDGEEVRAVWYLD